MGKLFWMFCNLWCWKSGADAYLHQSGTTAWRKALYGLTFWVQRMQYTALPRYYCNTILMLYLTGFFKWSRVIEVFLNTYSITKKWIGIGNSMICHDKYHEWYFEIILLLYVCITVYEWYLCQYHIKIILLFVYTTTLKRFVIFTCGHFKLSWNTSALSQSNFRNFSCSSIIIG